MARSSRRGCAKWWTVADKTWKKRERAVAKRLNGNRIPVTGERAGADCETPLLCVQVKHGRRRPAFLADWLSGIRGNAHPKGKVGIVVWSAQREKQGDAIVLLTLADFESLHGRVAGEPGTGAGR